jgi:uncharacterized cupredoxin-like copper-binding protein
VLSCLLFTTIPQLFAQQNEDVESRSPHRDRQPAAVKDAEEMQEPGITSDGTGGGEQGGMMKKMSAAIKLRCRMFMKTELSPYMPAAVMAVRQQLKLEPEQVRQLRQIEKDTQNKVQRLLNASQKEMLKKLEGLPATAMHMHEKMRSKMKQTSRPTTQKEDRRRSGRSDRHKIKESRKMMKSEGAKKHMQCPMMRMMKEMEESETHSGREGEWIEEDRTSQQQITVILKDYSITMPNRVRPGIIKLKIRNEGSVEHNLEIEGEGMEEKLEQNLSPGEEITMHVHLLAGTYKVYCPVGDHAERGMKTTLEVKRKRQQSAGE